MSPNKAGLYRTIPQSSAMWVVVVVEDDDEDEENPGL